MIGVFDSGIGGLTVVRAIMNALPERDIIYLGDTARTPYGSKSAQTIVNYSLNNVAFLLDQGARIIVIACNTASSYAYEELRSRLAVPLFEVIRPGAGLGVNRSKTKRIGVIGTRATIASGIYPKTIRQIDPQAVVYTQACPLLVPLVEEGWHTKPVTTMIVRQYLQVLKTKQIDTLILGCTHYPVLKEVIQRKIGRHVQLVDSAQAVAEQVQSYFHDSDEGSPAINRKPVYRFYVTDVAEQFQNTARLILKTPFPIQPVEI